MGDNKKASFNSLIENLEKLEKSEQPPAEPEVKIEEPAPAVVEPEVIQPVKEEEPEVKEEEKPAEPEEEVEKSCDDKKVEKSEDCDDDKEKDKEKPKDKAKAESKKSEDKEDKKDKEPVKKSAEEEISEADLVGAFEAVTKSYGNLRTELEDIKKSIASILELVKPAEEPVAKSAEPAAEETKEDEPEEEEIEKSVQPEEEEPEGKAVQFISKSNGVPELDGEPAPEEEEQEVQFNAVDHVKTVTDYFMKNANVLSEGQKFALRGAVNRVKRGEGTAADVAVFKEISEISEN